MTFEKKSDYDQHERRLTVPCDFYCILCKTKFSNKYYYKKHEQTCKPKQYTDEEVQKIQQMVNSVNVNNNKGVVNTNVTNVFGDINNNTNNNINLVMKLDLDKPDKKRLLQNGMCPHGQEADYFISIHGITICEMMFKLIKNNVTENGYRNEQLFSLLMEIIVLFYGNQKFPEYINIIDDEPFGEHNKIYSGEEFIRDFLTKPIRNRKILHLLFHS